MKNLYILTAILALTACVSKKSQPEYMTYSVPQYADYGYVEPVQIMYEYEDYNPQNEVIAHEIIMSEGENMQEILSSVSGQDVSTTYVTQTTYVASQQPTVTYTEQSLPNNLAVSSPEVVVANNPLLPTQKKDLKNIKTIYHRRPRVINVDPVVYQQMPNNTIPVSVPQVSGPEYLVK